MSLLQIPSRLAAAFRSSGTEGAFARVCLLSLAGCTGLSDIPDNPRLVAPPDESMPVIRTEPPPSPGSVSSPAEGDPEATPLASPAPNDDDTAGRNIEDE